MRVFVTGASGWIGSALVPELIGAGHKVVGLARSDASAATLATAGVEVQRGSLDDLDRLREAAAASDGVIHTAFKHDIAFSGDYQGAADADLRAIETIGGALAGSERPFVIASGTACLTPGVVGTEEDSGDPGSAAAGRLPSERTALSLASQGVRSSAVRLPPTVHGHGDHGFLATLIGIARDRGVSGYVGDGSGRWPAVHRLDAARLFRLPLESAPAGSVLHAVDDEGVATCAIAEAIARHLDLPIVSILPEDASEHFGWLGVFFAADVPASSNLTRERMAWRPTHAGLIDDLDQGHYFDNRS
jgi:nucleoside-diphosphate-sugar epimerase